MNNVMASKDSDNKMRPCTANTTRTEHLQTSKDNPSSTAALFQPSTSPAHPDEHDCAKDAEKAPKQPVAFDTRAALNIAFGIDQGETQPFLRKCTVPSGNEIAQNHDPATSNIPDCNESSATPSAELQYNREEDEDVMTRTKDKTLVQNANYSAPKNAFSKVRTANAQHSTTQTGHPSNRDTRVVNLSNVDYRLSSKCSSTRVTKQSRPTSKGVPTIDEAWNILKFAQTQERAGFEKALDIQRMEQEQELSRLRNKSARLESQCSRIVSELEQSDEKIQDLINLKSGLESDLSKVTAKHHEMQKALERESIKSAELKEKFDTEKTTLNDRNSELIRLLKDEKLINASLEQKLEVLLESVKAVEQRIPDFDGYSQRVDAINTMFKLQQETTEHSSHQLHELMISVRDRSIASPEDIAQLTLRVEAMLSR